MVRWSCGDAVVVEEIDPDAFSKGALEENILLDSVLEEQKWQSIASVMLCR